MSLLLLILLPALSVSPVFADDADQAMQVISPSLFKVVTDNGRRYVASGVALDKKHIVSSYLLASYPHQRIFAENSKGEKIELKMVGRDRVSGLVFLRTEKKVLKPARPAEKVVTGEWAALVGVSYHRFPAVFQGLVSAPGERDILLNVPVGPGSSGGAVVNRRGELLAVLRGSMSFADVRRSKDFPADLSAVFPGAGLPELAYAIPVARVQELLRQLLEGADQRGSWLGVQLREEESGLVLTAVVPDSPAWQAGLRRNDRLLSFAGSPVGSAERFSAMVQAEKPGQKVLLTVERDGVKKDFKVLLAERRGLDLFSEVELDREIKLRVPQALERVREKLPELRELRRFVLQFRETRTIGLEVLELSPELAEKMKIREGYGLLVARVAAESGAARGGIQVGDVVLKLEGAEVKTAAELRRAVQKVEGDGAMILEIRRNGRVMQKKVIPEKSGHREWFADEIEPPAGKTIDSQNR